MAKKIGNIAKHNWKSFASDTNQSSSSEKRTDMKSKYRVNRVSDNVHLHITSFLLLQKSSIWKLLPTSDWFILSCYHAKLFERIANAQNEFFGGEGLRPIRWSCRWCYSMHAVWGPSSDYLKGIANRCVYVHPLSKATKTKSLKAIV